MRAQALIALLATGPFLWCAPGYAQTHQGTSDAEVFEQVFHRSAARRRRVPLPVLIEGQARGETLAEVAGADVRRLALTPLVDALSDHLREDLVARLEADDDGTGWIATESLRRVGLVVRYDASRVVLDIEVPPALRKQLVHDRSGLPAEAALAVRPAAVSGYLNVRAGQGVDWTPDGTVTPKPLQLGFDSAVNAHDWVLEGSVSADGTSTWRRGDVRIVRDVPGHAVRFTAGDHAVPISGFQPGFPIIGVGGARNFSLQPYLDTRPSGRFSFVLERPSQVTVMVNGVPVRTLELDAGQHDVRNFALSAGVNDVRVVAKDDLGGVRTFSFTVATAGELLARGVSRFAAGGGFPLIEDAGLRTYDWERPTLYLSYERGLTSWLTAGSHAVGDRWGRVGGTRATAATRLGSFGVDLSVSQMGTPTATGDRGYGYAGGLRYGFVRAARGTAVTTSVGLSWEHRSPGFATLGPATEAITYRDDVSVSLSQSLGWRTLGSATARHRFGHDEDVWAQNAGLSVSRPFGGGFSASLSLTGTRSAGQPDAVEGFLSIHWVIPDKRQAILSSGRAHSSRGASEQVTWIRHGSLGHGTLATTATATGAPDSRSAVGSVDFTGHRVTASASHGVMDAATTGGAVQTTSVAVGTAVVMADGVVAWSRPVTGSFAIVAPNETLSGYDTDINPSPIAPLARANRFGPAVVSNLQPYVVTALNLDAPALPVGYSLGASRYWVLPSYKSGALIRYGERGAVSLRGILHGRDGQPMALVSGTVQRMDDGTESVFFTNRSGRFGLEALRAGRYQMRPSEHGSVPVEFAIPPGTVGGYSLGVLRSDWAQHQK